MCGQPWPLGELLANPSRRWGGCHALSDAAKETVVFDIKDTEGIAAPGFPIGLSAGDEGCAVAKEKIGCTPDHELVN